MDINTTIWTEGPLHLIEPDAMVPEEKNCKRLLHMARNSYESFQILLRSDEAFEIREVLFEDFSEAEELGLRYNFQETISFAKASFQDPLSNAAAIKVDADTIQSVWITVYAGSTVKPGQYQGNILLVTDAKTHSVELSIKVYHAVIPSNKEAAFTTEYWMNSVNFWFRYPSTEQLDFFQYYYKHEKYSDAWWQLNQRIAEHMKENRINVLFVRTHDLLLDGGTDVDENGTYHFCWELFDKWVSFFDKHADVKLFAGYHLVVQTEGRNVYLLEKKDGKMQIMIAPIEGEKGKNWMRQFLTALYAHLKELGIAERWLQHVEDEPSEPASWKSARKLVRDYMPGICCMDAIDRQEPMTALQGEMDLWIPRVDIYENNREFYDYRLAQGDRRWIYNCCEPHHQNYANKFLGWPLLHNRILPWACFVNHFNGFLHWGYDFWDPKDPWFGLNDNVQIKGDGYIVYPDVSQNSIRNSVRMIATRDGAQDFELLKLLADKDPKKAYAESRKAALRFNDFNWEPQVLEQTRIRILEALDSV